MPLDVPICSLQRMLRGSTVNHFHAFSPLPQVPIPQAAPPGTLTLFLSPLCPCPLTADVKQGEARHALQRRYECLRPLNSQVVAYKTFTAAKSCPSSLPSCMQSCVLRAHHMHHPHTLSHVLAHSPSNSSEVRTHRLCSAGTSAPVPRIPRLLSASHVQRR